MKDDSKIFTLLSRIRCCLLQLSVGLYHFYVIQIYLPKLK